MTFDVTKSEGAEAQQNPSRCGYVAIVGRPNVGKSTLLNHILGQKLSITSRRPQTTRHQVLGIETANNVQIVYVDTPGMHKIQKKAINRYMNKAASSALVGIDAIIFVVDRLSWTEEDQMVLEKVKGARCPIILAINKVDKIADKTTLMPYLESISKKIDFHAVMPISAQHGHNLTDLSNMINKLIPLGEHHFEEDQLTDRSFRFLAAELVREKVMRQLGDELPYEMTVEIEEFKHEMRSKNGPLLTISALILVERAGQKAIVIGDKGSRLKKIGQEARKDMEQLFDAKVMLNLWVKVKAGWSDDERALKSLGYDYNQ